MTDVYRWCRRVTDNSRNVAVATKGRLENTEGACWAHFLGRPHLDPLLSLCLCFGSLRKVNHRHLAAVFFLSFASRKLISLHLAKTWIRFVELPPKNPKKKQKCSLLIKMSYFNLKRWRHQTMRKRDKCWAVIKIHIYVAQFSLQQNSMCLLAGSIWSKLRKEMCEPPGCVISG